MKWSWLIYNTLLGYGGETEESHEKQSG